MEAASAASVSLNVSTTCVPSAEVAPVNRVGALRSTVSVRVTSLGESNHVFEADTVTLTLVPVM